MQATLEKVTDSENNSIDRSQMTYAFQKWMDRIWVIILIAAFGYSFNQVQSGRLCALYGVDFRGYYAAAQIALRLGFDEIYNPQVQYGFQESLDIRCPDGRYQMPAIRVVMPYLPVSMLVFLPFTFLEFTAAYYLWVILSLAALVIYLVRFTRALGENAAIIRILQWALCVPLFSNLFLGQINVLLVIFLGEFVLACEKGRYRAGGFWLGGMLLKPHLLILLLPGLVIRKNWGALLGFTLSGLVILLTSVFLAGWNGVWGSLGLAAQFSGPLIQTGPAMMNFRALAHNLEQILPELPAWTAAMCGIVLAAGFTLYLWSVRQEDSGVRWLILIIATLTATFAITWHSHFYLLTLLIPLLLALDLKGAIPPTWRWAWMIGPPIYFGMLLLAAPGWARNGFGLGMLAINLLILAWAGKKLLLVPGVKSSRAHFSE